MENQKEQSQERLPQKDQQLDRELDQAVFSVNARALQAEIEWLIDIIHRRTAAMKENRTSLEEVQEIKAPALLPDSAYGKLCLRLKLGTAERMLFILAFVPYFRPSLLTTHFRDEQHPLQVKWPQFGGFIKSGSRQFVPSMQTFLYLMYGQDRQLAMGQELMLREKSDLFKEGIILEIPMHSLREPGNTSEELLTISQEYVDHLKSGREPKPEFGASFPANRLSTKYEWDDLVLPLTTMQKFQEMMKWLKSREKLQVMAPKFNASAPILFYGSPGTGKSLTAQLIGKALSCDVFRIDLSMVVSKYVGETEKNLAHLFNKAENKDWILFFDEADSLFTKRTGVSNANDKWANLEVSYLLQRLESYNGISILASNIKENIDPAMTRRFRYIVEFTRPGVRERTILWQKLLPEAFTYHSDIPFDILARENVTGSNIANILFDACVQAVDQNVDVLNFEMIREGLIRELQKENRTPDATTALQIRAFTDGQKKVEERANAPVDPLQAQLNRRLTRR